MSLTGILLNKPQLPPLLQMAVAQQHPQAAAAAPAPSPAPAPASAPAPGGGGSWLSRIFGGAPDAGLSPEENEQAKRQAYLTAGLSMLAGGGRGGNPIATIAQGAMAGQSAGQALRERLKAKASMRRAMDGMGPEQRAVFDALSPELQQQVIAKLLTDPVRGPEPKVVGEGGALVDANGNVLYQGPGKPAELPSDLRGIAWGMGIDLATATPEQQAAVLKAWQDLNSSKATRVNVDARPPVQRGVDEIMLAEAKKAYEVNTSAQDQLRTLGVMEAVMSDPSFTSGRLDEVTMPLREIGASFGMANTDKLSIQQVFSGLANRMALDAKEGMTGPMSDKDIVFLQKMVPRLANTVPGNRMLVEISKRVARNKMAYAREVDRYLAERGSTTGLLAHMQDWSQNPANAIDLSDLRTAALGQFADLVPEGAR